MTACQSENRAVEEARESCEEGCAEATQGGREGSKAKSMKKGKPEWIEWVPANSLAPRKIT
jgi:hypothetical protein